MGEGRHLSPWDVPRSMDFNKYVRVTFFLNNLLTIRRQFKSDFICFSFEEFVKLKKFVLMHLKISASQLFKKKQITKKKENGKK